MSNLGSTSAFARQYAPYVQANWGLANHWYPGIFSHEVEVHDVKSIRIGGYDIAVTRNEDGTASAISDRCLHRGVKLSAKPMCFRDKTITCWYHGFTYNVETGNLDTIVGSPDDPLINTVAVQVFPTEEFAGIIWVFVGDKDFGPPPPIFTDIPAPVAPDFKNPIPHLQDPDIITRGIRRECVGNWRPAVENGLDPSHLLVHRDNSIVLALDRILPLGLKAVKDDATEFVDMPDGPKGVINHYEKPENYEPVFENPMLNIKSYGSTVYEPFRVSGWLPCHIMVENWPLPGYAQYEMMVPIDDKTHMYWEIIAYRATTDEEKADFDFRYENFFEPLGIRGFNDPDIFAREQSEEHYQRFDGWNNEVFAHADFPVVAWRKHASKFGRGFFESPYFDED